MPISKEFLPVWLAENNISYKRINLVPYLSPTHMTERIAYCQWLDSLSDRKRGKLIFSDEIRVNLGHSNSAVFPGEENRRE